MKRALDLFCCAGGATRGLQLAGYHVTGVDCDPQPRYIGDRFVLGDAMAWLRGEAESLDSFDLIWASPPCQRYTRMINATRKATHPNLLPAVAAILRRQPIPYIIETVDGGQVYMRDPLMLCGSMFGLGIYRHRYFEIGHSPGLIMTPPCNHSVPPVLITGVSRKLVQGKRIEHTADECRAASGLHWMRRSDMDQAIPPAYSLFLAKQIAAADGQP